MNRKDLLYIRTIAEEGGISQAARKLYVSQPSLSQTVHRIEEGLGVPLFIRTPRGLVLTHAGEEYYRMASQILKIYDTFEEELQNFQELKSGKVTVGVTTHRGMFLLPEFLADFHLRYPGITVNVLEESTDRLEELLSCGTIDFAFMRAPAGGNENRAMSYHGLVRDSFLILLPPGHPASKKAVPEKNRPFPVLDPVHLQDEHFLLPDPSMRLTETILTLLKKAGISSPRIVYSSIYSETLVRLVAAGQGISILPRKLSILPSLRTRPDYFSIPDQYGAYWEMCFVTLKNAYLSRAASAFADEFSQYIGAG